MNVHSKPNKPLMAFHRQAAFTLIEVMVGVAIFAIISAMVVGSLQSNADRNAKLEAERLIAVVNEVRDEAVISGKTFALNLNEKGGSYSFDLVGAQTVSQSVSDTLLRSRKLHKSVSFKWDVYEQDEQEDDFFNESEGDEEDKEPADTSEKVFVSPLGEITPFQVRFKGEDHAYVVELNDDGNLHFQIKSANFF